MKVATWNINGVKARLETVKTWLGESAPDVACLQEIKSVTEAFPSSEFEDLGYNVAASGQKSFNGVAILSKHPIDDVITALPGNDEDTQARYLEASIPLGETMLRIATIYLPNGNPLGTEKFDYKLAWMDRLIDHARGLLEWEVPVVLAGDYNVIPEARDARHPELWTGDALFQPESRDRLNALANLGFTDAIRACHANNGVFTFWDYQAGAWQKNNGIRIDHLMLNGLAADRLVSADIEKDVRGWEKPSDHVPVVAELRSDG